MLQGGELKQGLTDMLEPEIYVHTCLAEHRCPGLPCYSHIIWYSGSIHDDVAKMQIAVGKVAYMSGFRVGMGGDPAGSSRALSWLGPVCGDPVGRGALADFKLAGDFFPV